MLDQPNLSFFLKTKFYFINVAAGSSNGERAFFESFRAEDGLGDLRLSGGFNGAGPLGAVLQDADFAFGVGEPIFLELTPAASGQLFLFDIGASGAAKQLSPNSFGAPINLTAGVTRNVPEDRDGDSDEQKTEE